MTTMTTTSPSVDFGPLLELRERYLARAERLTAGIAERDPDIIAEAEQLVGEEERLVDAIRAQVEGLNNGGESLSRAAADGLYDIIYAISPTDDLGTELDDFRSERAREVTIGILDRMLRYLGDELRAHEVAIGRSTMTWIEEAARTFVKTVVSGWDVAGEATMPTDVTVKALLDDLLEQFRGARASGGLARAADERHRLTEPSPIGDTERPAPGREVEGGALSRVGQSITSVQVVVSPSVVQDAPSGIADAEVDFPSESGSIRDPLSGSENLKWSIAPQSWATPL